MKNKAIVFDIDGTAIDSPHQKTPSDRLVKAVRNAENNYYIAAATGRTWSFAKPVLQGLSLVDPCIISGGTQICQPNTGEIIWECDIDSVSMQKIVAIAKNYPDSKVLYNDISEDDYLHGGIKASELEINERVFFFEFIFVPESVAPEIITKLNEIDEITAVLVVAQRPGFNDIHITNKSATKEHAIGELISILGIERKNTIGIGDGMNDIHLFNAVQHKVAMGNAVDGLKEVADQEIDTVSNDGLAKYLESLS